MVTTKQEIKCCDQQYMDIGCSTYVTRKKILISKANHAFKNKVKFTSDNTLSFGKFSDVLIMRIFQV